METNYFKDSYTRVVSTEDGQCITRDFYRLMEQRALEIVHKHGMRYDPRDPDSSAEFWASKEGDFFQINDHAPELTIGELGHLLTFNFLLLTRTTYDNRVEWITKLWV